MAHRIGAVVSEVLRHARRRAGPLMAIRRQWGVIVGRRLAAHTKPMSLRSGRLIVHVDRPGDGFTLSYQRAELLERLQALTNERVDELIIRPGEFK